MLTNLKPNQKGVITHTLIGLLFLAVIVIIVLGYLNLKKQSDDNKLKEQQLTATTKELSALKSKQNLPDGWKTYNLPNKQAINLPSNYVMSPEKYGSVTLKNPDDDTVITVHLSGLYPSINSVIFEYDKYCQLKDNKWQAYINESNTSKPDTGSSSANCALIKSASTNGVNYFTYETTAGYNLHIAYVVKAGENYVVLNYEKYFNGYGSEAVKAMSIDQNKKMVQLSEKLASANK